MIFFTVLELILVGLRIAAAYFKHNAIFAAAATPLTYACIIIGVVALLFITAELVQRFRKK